MKVIYSVLEKFQNENKMQYDNRIEMLPPLNIGTAHFDFNNYNKLKEEFGITINWQQDFNNRVYDMLPEMGYYIKVDEDNAKIIANTLAENIVFSSLSSVEERIFPKRIYVEINRRPYTVMFNGFSMNNFGSNGMTGSFNGSFRYNTSGLNSSYLFKLGSNMGSWNSSSHGSGENNFLGYGLELI